MEKTKHTRTFVASSEIFSSFTYDISLFSISSIEEIITLFTNEIRSILMKHNLIELTKKLDDCMFHIHDHTIEDILTSKPEDIFYICDHR
tara:strand:- start:458 stop:727 length:270 start_codon:yes stop_codon:yes gene_type:complete